MLDVIGSLPEGAGEMGGPDMASRRDESGASVVVAAAWGAVVREPYPTPILRRADTYH
jgi:hypothetical protein